jgi:hypothetical protein
MARPRDRQTPISFSTRTTGSKHAVAVGTLDLRSRAEEKGRQAIDLLYPVCWLKLVPSTVCLCLAIPSKIHILILRF